MVTERELPVAHRIAQLLRCPVPEFPDERPPDIQPDCFEQLIVARQQIHLRESRKSFVAPGDLTTGVPLSLQSGAVPLTPSFAQPLPMTPPLQRPFWTDADKEMALTATSEAWEATAASVRAGESGGGLSSAGPASEDLFLAPQAVAEEAPLVSPVQFLPMVKPCPYTDIRLQDAAGRALHVGALVVYLASAFGSLSYAGKGSLTSAVEGGDIGGGGLPSAIRSTAPVIEGPTPCEMALPPQCCADTPYGHPFLYESVERRKLAWVERFSVMAESAMKLLDPDAAGAYMAGAFDVDRAISALYSALSEHSMVNATTVSAQQCRHLATSDDASLPMPPAYTWKKSGPNVVISDSRFGYMRYSARQRGVAEFVSAVPKLKIERGWHGLYDGVVGRAQIQTI